MYKLEDYGGWLVRRVSDGVVVLQFKNVDFDYDVAKAMVDALNASQQSFAPDAAMCEDCGKSPAMEGCSVCAECGL